MKLRHYLVLSAISWVVVQPIGLCAVRAEVGESMPPAEDMSYLDNGIIRLGVDLKVGGSITYLSAITHFRSVVLLVHMREGLKPG